MAARSSRRSSCPASSSTWWCAEGVGPIDRAGDASMPELKPAYLFHGDDHGAIAERRAGLRALIEAGADGSAGLELLEGESATPARAADALATMTLAVDRRVIIVEGVERWRQADVERDL